MKTVSVGIKDLKNNLSRFLDSVREGQVLSITDRGRKIAFILPAEKTSALEGLARVVREGQATWSGGKPEGSAVPAEAKGRPASEIVLEDRR